FDGKAGAGRVLIWPPMSNLPATLRKVGRARAAVLTGWAVDPNCRFRYQTDAAFPMSDHADFSELVEFVKRVGPTRVFTLHGFAADFAQTLREIGFEAQALSEQEQLALPLAVAGCGAQLKSGRFQVSGPEPRPTPVPAISEPTPDPSREGSAASLSERPIPSTGEGGGGLVPSPPPGFARFAETCAAIGRVSGKLEKVLRLAEYLSTLAGEALAWVSTWFTGYPFASSQNKVLQL